MNELEVAPREMNEALFQLNQKNQQIRNLKLENKDLETEVLNLEKEKASLITKITNYIKTESAINQLQLEKEKIQQECDEKLRQMKDELRKLLTKYEHLERKHEEEVRSFNLKFENIKNKVEEKQTWERLCKSLEAQLIEMSENERVSKEKTEVMLNKKQLEHENKFTDLKRKMMDHIKETQKNVTQMNVQHMDISTRLTLLQNHQLLIELEYQSKQIEELLHTKEKLEKKVFELSGDIEIHKEVEETLAEKNKKFSEFMRKWAKGDENSNVDFRQSTGFRASQTGSFNVVAQLEKKIDKLERELANRKTQYDTLKMSTMNAQLKVEKYEHRANGMIKVFENFLDDWEKDEEVIDKEVLISSVEKLKENRFQDLSKEEQYCLVANIVNRVVPVMKEEEMKTAERRHKKQLVTIKPELRKVLPTRTMKKTKFYDLPSIFTKNADDRFMISSGFKVMKLN